MNPAAVSELARTILAQRYDNPKPTPEFHEELWELCCLDHPKVAVAAPRAHAKTTAITGSYVISMLVFREARYVLIVSDTESQAAEFVMEIKREFLDNNHLIDSFGVKRLEKESQTDIIVSFHDGYEVRVIGKGAEQKVRGRKWQGQRPDLVVCHEKGTDIYADGRWIQNTDHPTATTWEADGVAVYVEHDNQPERVSSCHRYWAKRHEDADPEWIEAKDLRPGMFIGES